MIGLLRHLLAVVLTAYCAVCATKPSVLLITVDTTRADRMGFLGSKRGLTPNLDALAKQGVAFSRAYSQYPLTVPSHATILTGTYPQFHRVIDFGLPLVKSIPYLPDILHQNSYQTAAFVATTALDPSSWWVPGFARGFDTYEAKFGGDEADRYQNVEHRADYMVAEAWAWLKDHQDGPFFVWLHLYDPHEPYEPPEPFKTRFASEPYDGEIAFADAQLGVLFDDLRAAGIYDNTLIAVMSDHGEAFGEHGEFTHGIFLYDETIHVPLLFKMPKNQLGGQSVGTRVGLVDVVPTILDEVGIAIPKEVQGQSLLPLMRPADRASPAVAALSKRPAYSESDYSHRDFGWSSLRSLRDDKFLFVEAPRRELYDQSSDPNAQHNVAEKSPAVTQNLSSRLASFRAKTANTSKPGNSDVDPQLVQKLAALGYVGGGRGNEPPGAEMKGADPKDKIDIFNHVAKALLAGAQGEAQEEVDLLLELYKKDPNVEVVDRNLGETYLRMGKFEDALPVLRKAEELNPELSQTHYQIGQVLLALRDVEGAKKELQTAIAKSTLMNLKYAANLHFILGGIEQRRGNNQEALKELRLALQIEPDEYKTNLTLGRLLAIGGNPSLGVPYLQKAAKLDPKAPDPHLYLADAYEQLGRDMEADAQRAEAERLQPQETPN